MKKWFSCLLCGGLALAILASTKQALADEYEVDPVHSSVAFRIKHSNINDIYGIFSDIAGKFSVDGSGSFDVSVGVESINTGNAGRDRHLKSPDFFSARQFPRIEFKSNQVKRIDDETLEVAGELKLRGVTKPVTAKITTATGSGRGGQARGGIEVTLNVKRSDFTLGGPGGLGDDVTVMISLQGVKK